VRFHHTGIACRDLERDVRWFGNLGYTSEGSAFIDPLQGIKGQFMLLGEARIELLEALPDSRVLDPWLAHGSPLYHFGYEVSDIGEAIELLSASGAKLVSEPKPAVAFDGRHVAFLLRSNKMLVEVIEAAP
jgi:methylmalonyl-CoA/ethylmalonyl-CoA epimerase